MTPRPGAVRLCLIEGHEYRRAVAVLVDRGAILGDRGLCESCARCVDPVCQNRGVILNMDHDYREAWCGEHADALAADAPITLGFEIVWMDTARYAELTAPPPQMIMKGGA